MSVAEIDSSPSQLRPAVRLLPRSVAALVIFHLVAVCAPFVYTRAGLWAFIVGTLIAYLLGEVVGFHRLLSHRSFGATRGLERALAVFGTLSGHAGPIHWVALHRAHHANADGPRDPHSPRHGWWWSFLGWTVAADQVDDETWAPDLCADAFYRFLEAHRLSLVAASGVAIFLLGLTLGGWETAVSVVVWGFFLRIVVSGYQIFITNWLGHCKSPLGYRRYETMDDSQNHWWLAPFTLGETFHNNHHARPASPSMGRVWWEIDIAYLVIRGLAALRFANLLQDSDVFVASSGHHESRLESTSGLD